MSVLLYACGVALVALIVVALIWPSGSSGDDD